MTRSLLALARPAAVLLAGSALARFGNLALGIALLVIPLWGMTAGIPVGTLLTAMAICALLKAVLYYLEHYLGHLVAFRMLDYLRVSLFDALVPQAPAVVEQCGSGRLLERTTKDTDRLEVFYAHTIVPAIIAVLLPLAAIPWVGVTFGWLPALLLLLGLAAAAIIATAGGKRQGRLARTLGKERGHLAQEVADNVAGSNDIVAFAAEAQRLEVVAASGNRIGVLLRQIGLVVARRRGGMLGVQGATMIALAWWALDTGSQANLAVIGVAPGLFAAINGIEEFMTSLPTAFAAAAQVWELLNAQPAVSDPPTPTPLPLGKGTLTFHDVSFRYAGRTKDALSHVSFAVPAGAMVAIVGATGSGKSTLARLALRFWDVSGGAIRLDGADVSHLSLHDLRGAIALVEQTPFLFAGSVWENITLGTPEATKAQVEQAAQQAAIHGDITSWPDGYHTRVGERGQTLSGGQRQRLALARALVRGARVIVLDESTAHQDAVTQGVIMNQLRETGTTLLVIAHRLETVTSAHNVVVLDGGKLVEHGTPTQLLANGGEFARLAAIIN